MAEKRHRNPTTRSRLRQERLTRHGWSLLALALAACLLAWYLVHRWHDDRYERQARAALQGNLQSLITEIEENFDHYHFLLRGLENLLQAKARDGEPLTEVEFERLATSLRLAEPEILRLDLHLPRTRQAAFTGGQLRISGPHDSRDRPGEVVFLLEWLREDEPDGELALAVDWRTFVAMIDRHLLAAEPVVRVRDDGGRVLLSQGGDWPGEPLAATFAYANLTWRLEAMPAAGWDRETWLQEAAFHFTVLLVTLCLVGLVGIGLLLARRRYDRLYVATFKRSHRPMLMVGPKGMILEANEAAERFYGDFGKPFHRLSIFDLIVDADDQVRGLTDHAIDGRFRHRLSDGRIREVQVQHTSLGEGDDCLHLLLIEDLTGRLLFENALGQNFANLRAILDESPALIGIKDLAGRFILVNRRFEMLAGRPAQSYLGLTNDEVFPAEVAARVWRRDKEALARGGPIQYEESLPTLDGATKTFLTVKFPVSDQAGRPFGVCLIATDVTAQKEAERELRESENLFRHLFLHSPFGMNMVDPDMKYLRVNRAFCEMTGYREAELANLTVADITHPDDMAREAPLAAAVLTGKMAEFQMEKRYRRKDGEFVWGNLAATLIRDQQGEVLYGLGIVEDITAKKAAQERLRESLEVSRQAEADLGRAVRELENKNAELESFTYTVSHDLKSPLVTIQGFLGLIERDCREGNVAELQEDLAHVRSAAGRMQQLLDDLLQLSRVGRQLQVTAELPMAEVVAEALSLVRGGLDEKGIAISVAHDLPPVAGDRLRLVQVVQNLVENAIKYMGSQPEPRIEVGVDRHQEVAFFVRDNGIGIDPRYREKIFDLFEKIDGGSPGTGVGLALVTRIVGLHGGRVWVESTGVGTGSTFYFTLGAGSDRDVVEQPRNLEVADGSC